MRYRHRVTRTAAEAATEAATEAARTRQRFDRLDALRAVAIVWMAIFHFSFDLNHFGFTHQSFYTDPVWTVQRACIVSLFLFCAGVGQAVALDQGQPRSRFWRRWAQVAACAVLVSLGSWFVFPRSFISFGVLHCIAVALLVLRLGAATSPTPWAFGLFGLLALLLPQFIQHPWFDTRWTNWVGLVTRKPIAEDYVPLLPWLGVMCWGLAAGQWVLSRRRHWITGAVPAALAPLAVLGRWSLRFYMLHQPLMFGVLMAWVALRR